MPLDHYKTQVLLLHSEQSTLDSLSSGFGDRYTVHCATTGSEALTTLGETPINVIISAQKLPGMSGIEALREAKKRSPETIGILLASSADGDLEAVVGEQEVFQIVRGHVTSESLKKLVDNATQKTRLMALAESANDVAANMDEPAEHIIMETDENGSSIISDGTGRFPALSPEKVSAASAVGAGSVDVLVLTKDEEFLATIKESSRGMRNVHYASTLKQAEEAIREHKIGVAVVDAAMVGEKVEQLTLHLRQSAPRLVSIVAGRRDDGDMLMDLINRGKVYRFLLKPVSPGRARLAVEASIKHHLEAPDGAFKIRPGATQAPRPTPGPQRAAASRPMPAAKADAGMPSPGPRPAPAAEKKVPPADKPSAAPASQPAGKTGSGPTAQRPAAVAAQPESVRKDPPLGKRGEESPADDGLAAAFGDNLGGGGFRLGKPVLFGIGAVAIAAVAGLLLWVGGGDPDMQEPVVTEPVTNGSPSVTEQDFDFNAPAQESVDTSAQVNEDVAAVEAALLESRLDDAAAALQRIAETDPENARLPFLSSQLQQLQLRTYLSDARDAIRDTRFEDAANLLANARALGVDDQTEILAVAGELSAAQSQQQVAEILALATARLEEGDLLTPANDNARYYYQTVLASEPDNAAARQGLNVIASKLVLQARTEIDKGRLDAAEGLLDDARAIDASSSELAATTAALMTARDELAERERLAAEARRKKAAALIAAAQREEAERRAAAEAAAADEEAARQAAAESAAAEPAEEETPAETVAEDDTVAEPPAATANDSRQTSAAARQPADEPAQAAPAQLETVAISALTRTKYVAPKYPRAAERRGESGWVDVLFTVTVDGTVTDIEIRDSTPAGVFDKAALRAVEKWEFEPVIESGQAVEKRAGVRMMFALE